MKTGAVIVAAGHKWKNGTFQPMVPVGDSTVIRRIIITLKQAGIAPVVVVTGNQGDELEKHISKLRVICLRNEQYAETQMFYSVCMGLKYIEDLCDRVLVMPAKFPMFLQDTVKRLLESDAGLTYPVCGGQKGHPMLVSCRLISRILSYKGECGLRGFVMQPEYEGEIREIPVEDEGIMLAVESESDCAAADLDSKQIDIHPQIQLSFGRNESFFGPSAAQFLSLIDHTNSMQTACRQMHMSYTKGWKILKDAEKQLGYPLLVTRSGGADGGFSQLTDKAKDLLDRYLRMESELQQEGEQLFKKYFLERL
ncbi:MAG: NTP transferase domain-containing protein [Enterocloster sp.]